MDAKSMLRAKKAEARIEHPYAAYSASGQLRCSICAVPVKQWDAHLLTKAHRQSVAREKASAAKAQKRSASNALESDSKRARVEPEAQQQQQSTAEDDGPSLPAGFFSSGKGPSVDDEEDGDEEEPTRQVASVEKKPVEKTGDQELDDFLASLEDDEPVQTPAVPENKTQKSRYQSSSSAAVPSVASYEAAPVLVNSKGDAEAEQQVEVEQEPEESEQERRERLEREEKEEIMDRLEEEERAQEDADSRVAALKARMEALKKKREARTPKDRKKSTANGA